MKRHMADLGTYICDVSDRKRENILFTQGVLTSQWENSKYLKGKYTNDAL